MSVPASNSRYLVEEKSRHSAQPISKAPAAEKIDLLRKSDALNARTKQSAEKTKQKTQLKNALSKVRPGYIAPLQLSVPSLDKLKFEGGMESLRKTSLKQDYKNALERVTQAKRNGVLSGKTPGQKAMRLQNQGMIDPSTDKSLSEDLHLIRHRNYLDPKRFYKNPDQPGKWAQRGTYVEDGLKVRHGTLVDQILGSHQENQYVKRKYKRMQHELQEKSKRRRRLKK